ncbi:hypothetical protein COS31_04450 [Candidatus Roizmanbacteria bacterium CG02_land_8_20_14_3_00_36_15]|uniref:Transcriptional regulator, AbiEi antitoxin, Type IV TA system n=1 Tax=Candidatus Roizmanbacteria bacterium CG_4_8_14_3_um_filter_36_10 TaxID=1974834 RepID=A0A2M8GNV3_9BACT|nr:MAG: hypothetical protein COS51_02255 [Candidatus Roizmanbacteria bacterium CG03_land_8_20_14_0_80_36_21]PIV37420.1 MAG: hypothetical protein COS31_04450 [Candidatus Roizmanbacteria bacterium CG02_land_8_20_14_3_00_36_15]PIY70495.1 MAG: hypothetical protein COY89_00500 [Candidatus Roizmanbacteria bacterium CG_4_10_14_0_8_um_filter_36_36]PJA53309.1 MAG: hypothetical protein CO166_02380 [Candidatus Roizmanbacteria bacterium CG_4_9_14_3_um_filter_36_11]PJC82237.1 MAG: hypothetical protein CO007
MLKYLINTGKTVFSSEDLGKILEISNKNYLAVLLWRMVKRKELIRIRKGIYAYSLDYNNLELANKLKRPSYVSLEKVLFDNSIIFQDYSNKITSVSNNNYSERVGNTEYIYYKIKDEILFNPLGILTMNKTRIASVERAICDTLYLSKNFYFDRLDDIDKEKLIEISKIYNKRVIAEIKKYV